MRKLILLLSLFLATVPTTLFSAAFTPGNLVVVRIGDGGGSLSNASAPVFLDEYTITGTLVQSIALPTTVSAPNYRLVLSGTGTSEGALNLSTNTKYLCLAGYDANTGVASIAGTSTTGGTPVLRVFGLVDEQGAINTSNATEAFSGGNPRSLITTDGSALWGAGSNSGARYMLAGGLPNSSVQLSTTPTNLRVINIINGQLYVTSASGTFQGIATIGTGIPTTSGQTTTLLSGFPTATGPSPYGFSISPDGNTAYVADDRAAASGGGVQKWTLSGGVWTLQYTMNTGLGTSGIRGMTVDWITNANVLIVGTTTNVTSNNAIVTAFDLGSNAGSPFTTIVAGAGTNKVFRGISYAPFSNVPVEMASFTSSVSGNSVELNWRTVSEQNNSGFDIQRKTLTSDWVTIGNIAGNGTSNNSHDYSFKDKNLSSGKYNYRLKQIDYNGNFKYYDLMNEIVVGAPDKFSLSQNYPNPFNPVTTINYELPVTGFVTLKIYDLAGKEVASIVNQNQTAGFYSMNFDASKLSSGIYFYTLKANDFVSTRRMILVK